jgi:hypothetical protein
VAASLALWPVLRRRVSVKPGQRIENQNAL